MTDSGKTGLAGCQRTGNNMNRTLDDLAFFSKASAVIQIRCYSEVHVFSAFLSVE
jgi:hypothetical protein